MIKLNHPDPLLEPVTPDSSRPPSVAETSIVDSAIAFDSRFDSDDDVTSSVFSELDEEEQIYQKPIKGKGLKSGLTRVHQVEQISSYHFYRCLLEYSQHCLLEIFFDNLVTERISVQKG